MKDDMLIFAFEANMASIPEVRHLEKGLILNRCEILSNNTQQIKYRHTSFYCTSLYGTL